jgi:hypothetical protein
MGRQGEREMQEQQQDSSGQLDGVLARLRGRLWRDWVVATLFVLGVAVNFTAVSIAVKSAMATPAPVNAQAAEPDPDGGLLVFHGDRTQQPIELAE